MKKLLSFLTIAIAAITFASVSTSCSKDDPFLDEEEVTVESRDAAGMQFIRNNKITIGHKISAGNAPLQLYMGSPVRENDLAILFKLRISLRDGTSQEFNFLPTIYAGERYSAPITVPGVYTDDYSGVSMIDATVILQ